MANWVSDAYGNWYPAKEKVALVNTTDKAKVIGGKVVPPGEPYIYEGPDRAAEFELAQIYGMDAQGKPKGQSIGMDFRHDPELIGRAKNLGFNDVTEYAKAMGWDKEKADAKFKEQSAVIVKHELPTKKEGKDFLGGGRDTSGQGNDVYGGFGVPKEMK